MEEYELIEYLKGTLDQEASREVEEWISSSDENQKTIENLYVLLFVSDRMMAKSEINVNKAFDEFQQSKKSKTLSNKVRSFPILLRVASIAAIFILLLLFGTFTTLLLLERQSSPIVVSTDLGERVKVILPDGSKVWLNAYSHLEYKQSFFSRNRKADLKGEAYFEVSHNNILPFVVANNDAEIKVLGTKFNVRSNDDENYLSTTLIEGAVLFSDHSSVQSIELEPGQELIFNKKTHQVQVKQLSFPQDMVGWVEGKLIFENTSLEEIAKSLERHYNVNIEFKDENVKKERFNAEFEMADNIYQILSTLELTRKFNYERDKREIVISSE